MFAEDALKPIFDNVFHKTKNYAMQRSRFEKLDHFYSLCDSKSSVIDIGVSANEYNEYVNLFLSNFRLKSRQYTGLSIEPMDRNRKKYPDKLFVEYGADLIPFPDTKFDWVFSNAVIEHVGNREDQLAFLNEMLRVGKRVFFTTPNKWFPVESHTNVFFRHWFNDAFYKWCKTNQPYWSIENLLLFGIKELYLLMEQSNAKSYKIHKNRTFGWPMTFTVVCSKEHG